MFSQGEVKRMNHYKGDRLFSEGDPGDAAYIVESGSVGIYKDLEGENIHLATLHQGELFGEMAVIDGSPRMASAVVMEDCVVVKIAADLLDAKLKKTDAFLSALIKILVTNLREVHRAYMRRPRSVNDYINALAFHAKGLQKYVDSSEGADSRDRALELLESVDFAVKTLRDFFSQRSDRRKNVVTDTDL